MYADDEKMQMMYGGFESWLNKYGKDITVGKKSNKTLHLVVALVGKSVQNSADSTINPIPDFLNSGIFIGILFLRS